MIKQESTLILAYTGFMLTESFSDMHEFIEKTMERPVFTYELANQEFKKVLQKKLLPKIQTLIQNIK